MKETDCWQKYSECKLNSRKRVSSPVPCFPHCATEELDERTWTEFSAKLQEWQEAVEQRDNIIAEKDELILTLQEELSAIKKDEDVVEQFDDTLDGMKKAIINKDKKILHLKSLNAQLEADLELLANELQKTDNGSGEEVPYESLQVTKALNAMNRCKKHSVITAT